MPQKARVITIVSTLAVLWAVNNVKMLEPVRDFMKFDY
jgi:hypothetical protein